MSRGHDLKRSAQICNRDVVMHLTNNSRSLAVIYIYSFITFSVVLGAHTGHKTVHHPINLHLTFTSVARILIV
jgi:hypothetical protein